MQKFSSLYLYVSVIAIGLGLSSCSLFQLQKAFQVVQATQQKYIAGVPEGGSSLHYTFKLIPVEGVKFHVDTIWVDSIPHKARQLRTNKNLGDTIVIKAIRSIDEKTEANYQTSPPQKLKGRALLQYRMGEERRYYTVDSLKELEPVPLP